MNSNKGYKIRKCIYLLMFSAALNAAFMLRLYTEYKISGRETYEIKVRTANSTSNLTLLSAEIVAWANRHGTLPASINEIKLPIECKGLVYMVNISSQEGVVYYIAHKATGIKPGINFIIQEFSKSAEDHLSKTFAINGPIVFQSWENFQKLLADKKWTFEVVP